MMSNELISLSYLFDVEVNKCIYPIFSYCSKTYHALYVFILFYIKLFSHLTGIIEVYSLGINSYAKNYGICMEYYIAIARSKGGCSDLKGIVREFSLLRRT